MVGRREDFLRGGGRAGRSPEIPPMRVVSLVAELVLQMRQRAATCHACVAPKILPTLAVKIGLLLHLLLLGCLVGLS